MAERTIIKRSIADCFEKFMKQGRVLFFSAPCGFGKTCVADALTEGKSVLRLSAADPDFAVPSKAGSWRILRARRTSPFPPFRTGGISCSSTIFR